MGSNIQVEFMIGSLPLAVLTQRCARTSNYPSHPRHNTLDNGAMHHGAQSSAARSEGNDSEAGLVFSLRDL